MTTGERGLIAELKVMQRAQEKGIIVSKPIGQSRYDLILDCDGKLIRAQVKYGNGKCSHADGAIIAQLRRWRLEKLNRRYTKDEIDILLVYVPKIDNICCFGPEHWEGKAMIYIRLEPPKNNIKNVLLATKFLW